MMRRLTRWTTCGLRRSDERPRSCCATWTVSMLFAAMAWAWRPSSTCRLPRSGVRRAVRAPPSGPTWRRCTSRDARPPSRPCSRPWRPRRSTTRSSCSTRSPATFDLEPAEVMTDTAAYADTVFGLFWLLGYQFSPRLADIGDARFWRIDRTADYGPLDSLARHRVDVELIRRNWEDLLRLAGSLKLGRIHAGAIMRVLQAKDR